MMRQRSTKSKQASGRQVRFPGICEFAESANVTRIHAYRVLTGERRSPRLEKLWSAFRRQQAN